MKNTKRFTHYWFVLISVLSFLIGWGMLAHSLKPVQPSQSSSVNNSLISQLPPIQSFGSGSGNTSSGLNLISPAPQMNSGVPLIRTGGS